MPAAERGAFLAALRRRPGSARCVEPLLAAHEDPDSFLDAEALR